MKLIFSLIFIVCVSYGYAQDWHDTIEYKSGDYVLNAMYDDSSYTSNFVIRKKDKIIYESGYENYDKIIGITSQDLESTGNKQYLIDMYTGGAHCCFILLIAEIKNDKFNVLDTMFWGNSGYTLKDLDKDGKMEFIGRNDAFAYAFTNYAQSYLPISIYQYKRGRLYFVNKDFRDEVEDDIKEIKKNLKEYLSNHYECPKTADEETFNTDAGAIKAMLGPIVADYHSIGQASEGYDYVNKVYKCPDKTKFISILKNDFKLK